MRLLPIRKVESLSSSKQALKLLSTGNVRPLGNSYAGCNYRRNQHGAFSFNHTDTGLLNITQLFISKELWGIDTYALDLNHIKEFTKFQVGYIANDYVERVCVNTLNTYLALYKDILEITPPIRLIAGMTGVNGYRMLVPNSSFNSLQGRVVTDNIEFGSEIDDLSEDSAKILEPFFNRIWEECGLDHSQIP